MRPVAKHRAWSVRLEEIGRGEIAAGRPAVRFGGVCDGPDAIARGEKGSYAPVRGLAPLGQQRGMALEQHVVVPGGSQPLPHPGKHSGFAAFDVNLDEPHAADARRVECGIEAARRALEIGRAVVDDGARIPPVPGVLTKGGKRHAPITGGNGEVMRFDPGDFVGSDVRDEHAVQPRLRLERDDAASRPDPVCRGE